MVLYVTEQGATLALYDGRAVVRKARKTINDIPALKLEQVVLFGNINMTPAMMTFCLAQGVDVAFISSTGKYRGRLQPEFSKNAVLRQQQYSQAINPEFCRRTAAAIVTGKIKNMIAMIRRQRRLREEGRSPISELETVLPRVATARNVESLNGYEGTASAAYFAAFRAALKSDWGFQTRSYHPPADPVNVLLSLGYTLLYNNVHAAVNIVGLDPYMGYFHRPRHGHAALVSDLMEEYRAVIVDPMILTALNKRILTEKDFQRDASGRLVFQPDGLKRFLELYAARIMEIVHYAPKGINTSYRQLIEFQVRHFARVIMGEDSQYRPYIVEALPQAY